MDKSFFEEKTYREGSMGAAEAKAYKMFRIVAAVVYAFILSILYVFDTDQNFLQEQAGPVWGIIGFILILASYFVIWFGRSFEILFKSAGWTAALIVGLLVSGWLCAVGFQGRLDTRYLEKEEIVSPMKAGE